MKEYLCEIGEPESTAIEVVSVLQKGGVNRVLFTDKLLPLLHLAAEAGHEEFVKFLLNYGADVTVVDADGQSSLHVAAKYGHKNIAEILIEYGAQFDRPDKKGITSLSLAVTSGRGVAKLIIEKMVLQDLKKPESLKSYQALSDYWEESVIFLKKNTFNGVSLSSFYSIEDKNRLAVMSRNKQLETIITSKDFTDKYPVLSKKIKENFKKGSDRVKILDRSVEVFQSSRPPFVLSPELWEKTLSNLSTITLHSFFKKTKSTDLDDQNHTNDSELSIRPT